MKIIYTKTELIKETSEKNIFKAVSGEKTIIVKEFSEDKREIYTLLKNKKLPGIPEIYSVNLSDRTVITEEYIDGMTLYDFISSNKNLNLKTALKIAVETATIISGLHSIGIIHRDITPSNIFISKEDKVYIIDFDIARTYKPEAPKDTQLLGTVGYAPPEQFGFGPTDYKSDIYAFGMSMKDLFFLVKEKHHYAKIFEKCTAFDPERRYKSMNAVVRSLKTSSKKIFTVAASLIAIILIGFTALSAIESTNSGQSLHNDNSTTTYSSSEDAPENPHTHNPEKKDSVSTPESIEIVPPGKESDSASDNSVTDNESKPDSSNQSTSPENKSQETESAPQIKKSIQTETKDTASVSPKKVAESYSTPSKEVKEPSSVPQKKVQQQEKETTLPAPAVSENKTPQESRSEKSADTPKAIKYKCFFCDNPPITVIGQNRYCAKHAPKCTNCGTPLTSQNSGLCESCAFKKATEQDAS